MVVFIYRLRSDMFPSRIERDYVITNVKGDMAIEVEDNGMEVCSATRLGESIAMKVVNRNDFAQCVVVKITSSEPNHVSPNLKFTR